MLRYLCIVRNIVVLRYLYIIYMNTLNTNYGEINIYLYELLSQGVLNKYTSTTNNTIKQIYHTIHTAIDNVPDDLSSHIKISKKIKQKSNTILASKFVPHSIKTYIDKTKAFETSLRFRLNNIDITILIYDYKRYQLIYNTDSRLFLIYAWLSICLQNNKTNLKKLTIYLYQTHFIKKFPKQNHIIDVVNVNSGVSSFNHTYNHNTIIIYRREEWFKVFIHETMHAFKFQPTQLQENKFKNIFKNSLSREVLISESYVEIWARFITCAFASYMQSTNLHNFNVHMKFYTNLETLFAIFQSKRILQHMGLTYNDLISLDKSRLKTKYKEKTNVFAYYIITGVFFSNIWDTMDFFKQHNTNLLYFDSEIDTINKFIRLYNDMLNSDKLQQLYDTIDIENYKKKYGLRMSILDILGI